LTLKERAQDNAGRFGRDDAFGKGAPENEERQPEGRPSKGGQALRKRRRKAGPCLKQASLGFARLRPAGSG